MIIAAKKRFSHLPGLMAENPEQRRQPRCKNVDFPLSTEPATQNHRGSAVRHKLPDFEREFAMVFKFAPPEDVTRHMKIRPANE